MGGTGNVAAVDIGSNSTNFLVCDANGNDIERMSTTTRLGAGIDTRRRFDPDAVERTLACLESYRSSIEGHGIERIRCVATSASRRASNFAEFADRARSTLGRDIELIDGVEEGRLAFVGARARLESTPGDDLVIDIGGGSTEFACGNNEPEIVHSLELGAVRLTEKFLVCDPPLPEELVNAIADVRDLVEDTCRAVPRFTSATRVVGCSGTILAIAAVERGATRVPSGFVLTRSAAEDVFRTLATESLTDRIHNPGLPQQRADIIVGGCCILVGILRSLDIGSITVSAGNMLDGICQELRANR